MLLHFAFAFGISILDVVMDVVILEFVPTVFERGAFLSRFVLQADFNIISYFIVAAATHATSSSIA